MKIDIKNILVLIFIISSALSCRLSRPFPSIRTSKNIAIGTFSHSKTITKKVKYFSLRYFEIIGTCSIISVFDSTGTLQEKTIEKISSVKHGCCDRPFRWITKTKHLDANGKLEQIDYLVKKGGYMTEILLDKSIFFENGKRILTKDNLKK